MFWKIKSSVVFAVIMLYALPSFALSQNVNGVVWQYTVSNRKATIGGIPEYATSEPTSAWLGSRMARKRGFAINS